MRVGPNTEQVVILRRGVVDGHNTGEFADCFTTWAMWTQNPGHLAAVSGQREDPIDLVLTVNDSPRNRTICVADRLRAKGQIFEIASVALPERKSGTIRTMLQRIVNG